MRKAKKQWTDDEIKDLGLMYRNGVSQRDMASIFGTTRDTIRWALDKYNIKEKTMETKKCTKCGRELPVSEFYTKEGTKLQSQCKDCCKAHGRLRNGRTGKYKYIKEYDDAELINELKLRGYSGTLTKSITIEL